MKTTSGEAIRPLVQWVWKFLVSCCNPFIEKMEKTLYILLQVETWRNGCHSSKFQWGIRPCHKKEAWKLLNPRIQHLRFSLSSIMPQNIHRIFVSPTQTSRLRICPTKPPHSCSFSTRVITKFKHYYTCHISSIISDASESQTFVSIQLNFLMLAAASGHSTRLKEFFQFSRHERFSLYIC